MDIGTLPNQEGLTLNRRTALHISGQAALFGPSLPCPEGPAAVKKLRSSGYVTTDLAKAIYGRHKVCGTSGWIRHDVDVHRIEYTTRDVDGQEIVASGAVLIPKGVNRPRLMCYSRGTIIPVTGERIAPSYYEREKIKNAYDDHYEMSFLAATFGAAGYLVVAPDGIGYGASRHLEHPYLHASSLAWSSLDMLRATREFVAHLGIAMDPRVFITGWSEGGLCGMALHKLIQETCRDEYSVASSSLLGGTYALSAQIHLFCSYDEDYPESQTNYWKLRTMCRVYKLRRPFDRTVAARYATALEKDVMAPAPKNPRIGLEPEFRERFLKGEEPEMERALRDNDRYDWKPEAPVFLHHGTHDDIVPFFCAQMAYESMRAKGCSVRLYPYLRKDHYQPANDYVVRTLGDFAKR